MDLTILYRVLWAPSGVFRGFREETKREPFLLLGAFVVITTFVIMRKNDSQIMLSPMALVVGLLTGTLRSLLHPAFGALIVQQVSRHLFSASAKYVQLLSALILCGLPYYISSLLSLATGIYGTSFGIGSMIPALQETNPILFGFLATIINPFSIWSVVLTYIALKEIFGLDRKQGVIVVLAFIVSGILISGLWIMQAVLVFNIFNPIR